REGHMTRKSIYGTLGAITILAGSLLAVSVSNARDTRTGEPVFDFSSPFVAPQNGPSPLHYIWKINRIDGSLYLCQTGTSNIKCNQVAAPNGELGPFTLSDAVAENTAAGFHVWRLNRWTGTQELCLSSTAEHGCSK